MTGRIEAHVIRRLYHCSRARGVETLLGMLASMVNVIRPRYSKLENRDHRMPIYGCTKGR